MIIISDEIGKSEEMIKYELETGKKAIWRGQITESFKKWQKGEKIYEKDKERITINIIKILPFFRKNLVLIINQITKLIRLQFSRKFNFYLLVIERLMLNLYFYLQIQVILFHRVIPRFLSIYTIQDQILPYSHPYRSLPFQFSQIF